MIISLIIGAFETKRWATRHPRMALGVVGAGLGLLATKRACEENGLIISRRPLVSVFRPPLSHLAYLLETTLPEAEATGGMGGASSMVFKGQAPTDADEVRLLAQVVLRTLIGEAGRRSECMCMGTPGAIW